MATYGIKGAFHHDLQTGDWWIGDTELRNWLLSHFLQGANISIQGTELPEPKGNHIPESERWQ